MFKKILAAVVFSFVFLTASATPTHAASVLNWFDISPKPAPKVIVRWETGSETLVLGFNIQRAQKQANGSFGDFKAINSSLLPAQNLGQPIGTSYRFVDETVKSEKTYKYRLDVIGIDSNLLTTSDILKITTP